MNTSLDALLDSAYQHSLAGRYAEAIPDYQAALQLAPENINAHFNLHLTYLKTSQLQRALQELEEFTRLSPSDSGIYYARAYLYDVLALSENSSALQEIISQLPSDADNRSVLAGLQAHQRKNYPQALAHFEKAMREQPDAGYIQGYIGRTLIFLGRNAEAREALSVAAKDDRARSTEFYNLGVAQARLRDYAAAVQALERAVQLDSAYYKAWNMLARMEWRRGRLRSALRYFRQAVNSFPEMQAHRQRTTLTSGKTGAA